MNYTIVLAIEGSTPTGITLDTLTHDGDAVVQSPALPQAFDDDGDGSWSIEVSGVTAGEGYVYTYTVTWSAGVASTYEGSFTAPLTTGADPESPFHTYAKFLRRWGTENVRKASNKDNDDTAIDADAVQDAFDHAESEINNTLAGGALAVPLNFAAWDDVVPATVQDWAMTIAYAYLYEARGWDDKNKTTNKIGRLLQVVYLDMGFYKAGVKQLSASAATDTLTSTAVGQGIQTFTPRNRGLLCRSPDETPSCS